MSVYVDDRRVDCGWRVVSYVAADTPAELLEMATLLGIPARYVVQAGTSNERLEISQSKRDIAIWTYGATEVTQREMDALFARRRKA